MMDSKTLVYQAYGSSDVIKQAHFSILSLLKKISNRSAIKILIYTDQEDYFQDAFKKVPEIELVPIKKSQIEKWRGDINFVHRVKIEILIDAAQRSSGCLYYSDGDTRFIKCPLDSLSQVNDRISLMHIAEGVLQDSDNTLTKKIYKFTKKHHFHIGTDDAVAIGASTVMWNAGFIGISQKNKSLLPLILQLTDQTYKLYQKHVMEQLAVSYVLQMNSEVRACDDCVHHYWDQKEEYQNRINDFFLENKNLEDCLKNFDQFIPPDLVIPNKKIKKTFWRFFRG